MVPVTINSMNKNADCGEENLLQSALFFVSYELYNIRNITVNHIADIVQSIQCDAVIFS